MSGTFKPMELHPKTHHYKVQTLWTGNTGTGTESYTSYDRDHDFLIPGKPNLKGSADHAFRGDKTKHNPEELLVASLSSCHMLWYLHLCAVEGVVVTDYVDEAEGMMVEKRDMGGFFQRVLLKPKVTVQKEEMVQKALDLHHKAHINCFIANSVNFPVEHEATILIAKL